MARSDVEERVAEECLAWKHKNVPAWPKDANFLRNLAHYNLQRTRQERDQNMYTAWR